MRSTTLLVASLWVCLANGQADKVDAYVQSEIARTHTPGMAVAVVQRDRVAFSKAYGLSNVELSAPASADSLFELLSITKQFTATAALMLANEKKIELDQPASAYLADLPQSWSGITVRQLLNHTSGIPDYVNAPSWKASVRLDRTPLDLVRSVFQMPLQFTPGEQWRYSNTNYYLLGLIIEKVSGESYNDFLVQRVFMPLGMKNTRVDDYREILPGRAAGYHLQGNTLQNAEYISPSQKWAAGAVISSTNDLAKWIIALDTGLLLKRDVLEQMWTAAKLKDGKNAPYGIGTELDSAKGHRVVGHSGSGLAFNTSLIYLPEDHLGVVVLANLTQTPSEAIARHIASIYLPELSDEGNSGIQDQNPKFTEIFRATLLDAAQGKVDPARIAPESKERLVPFLQSTGPRFLGRLGTLQSVSLLEDTPKDNTRVRRYRTVFSSGQKIIWTVATASDGTLISLEPRPE